MFSLVFLLEHEVVENFGAFPFAAGDCVCACRVGFWMSGSRCLGFGDRVVLGLCVGKAVVVTTRCCPSQGSHRQLLSVAILWRVRYRYPLGDFAGYV